MDNKPIRPLTVTCISQENILKSHSIDAHDSTHLILNCLNEETNKTVTLLMNNGWIDSDAGSTAVSYQKYMLKGSKGQLEIDSMNRGITCVDDKKLNHPNPYFSSFINGKFQGYGFEAIESFVLKVKNGMHNSLLPNFDQYRTLSAILKSAALSINSGGSRVNVN